MDAPPSIASPALRGADGALLRRPIAYLDQSTLSDAFLSQRPGEPPNSELASLARRMASRGTLCYSLTHVIETMALRYESAMLLGRSLEQLEHRWLAVTEGEETEPVESVRWRLGATEGPPPLPVHFTMMAAMRENLDRLTPSGTVELLSDPTIAGCVRQAHGRVDWTRPKMFSIGQFNILHVDRTTLPPGTKPDDVREVTSAKFVRALKIKARDALHTEPIIIGAPPLTDAAIDAAVDQLVADPLALPMTRISHHAHFRVGELIPNQIAGSKAFNERYASFLWDLRHLVSASFADVFTCDEYVDRVLGDFRTVRGLPKQLSVGGCGGPASFIAALAAQVDEAERTFHAISAA